MTQHLWNNVCCLLPLLHHNCFPLCRLTLSLILFNKMQCPLYLYTCKNKENTEETRKLSKIGQIKFSYFSNPYYTTEAWMFIKLQWNANIKCSKARKVLFWTCSMGPKTWNTTTFFLFFFYKCVIFSKFAKEK